VYPDTNRETGMASATRPPTGDPRATPAIVKDVVAGTQTLARQELELARLEMTTGLAAYGQAAGLGGAAGMLGLYVLGFLGLAGGFALAEVMAAWLAFLIVAGVFLLLLVILLLVARSRARAGSLSAVQAKDSINKDLTWAKRLLRR
jgi:hypothetical protein